MMDVVKTIVMVAMFMAISKELEKMVKAGLQKMMVVVGIYLILLSVSYMVCPEAFLQIVTVLSVGLFVKIFDTLRTILMKDLKDKLKQMKVRQEARKSPVLEKLLNSKGFPEYDRALAEKLIKTLTPQFQVLEEEKVFVVKGGG